MIYYRPEDEFPGVEKYYHSYVFDSCSSDLTRFDVLLYTSGYRREMDKELILYSLRKLAPFRAPWMGDFLLQFSTAKEANSYLNKAFGLRGRVATLYDGSLAWRAYTLKVKRYLDGVFIDVFTRINSPYFSHQGEFYLNDDGITEYLLRYDTCDEHPDQMFAVGSVCPLCAAKYQIYGYTTNVLHVLKRKNEKKKGLPLGVELEYDTDQRKVAQALKPLEGFAIAKRDGSILGYEIVSLPATLPEHLGIFKAFLFEEQTVSSRTGMHVHMDSQSLSNLTVAKMYAFLYAEENRPFITAIAGRDFANNSYCSASGEGLLSRFSFSDDGTVRQYSNDRYTALNNSSKHGTIECRIFASPSSWKEFAYRMQFVQAMVEYCSAASIQAVKKWNTFVEFIKNSQHKELKEFLCA